MNRAALLLTCVNISALVCHAARTGSHVDLNSDTAIARSNQTHSTMGTICCCYSGSSCSDGYKLCSKDNKRCSWANDYCAKTVTLEVVIGGTYNRKTYTERVACGGNGKCGAKICRA